MLMTSRQLDRFWQIRLHRCLLAATLFLTVHTLGPPRSQFSFLPSASLSARCFDL